MKITDDLGLVGSLWGPGDPLSFEWSLISSASGAYNGVGIVIVMLFLSVFSFQLAAVKNLPFV